MVPEDIRWIDTSEVNKELRDIVLAVTSPLICKYRNVDLLICKKKFKNLNIILDIKSQSKTFLRNQKLPNHKTIIVKICLIKTLSLTILCVGKISRL